jgi:hypothetical protein
MAVKTMGVVGFRYGGKWLKEMLVFQHLENDTVTVRKAMQFVFVTF